MNRKIFLAISIASVIVGLLILYYGKGFVRFYVGDTVAVVFLYALASVFTSWKPSVKVIVAGLIALTIECAQIFIAHPGNGLQQVTLGAYFDPLDLAAYALGLAIGVVIVRALLGKRSTLR